MIKYVLIDLDGTLLDFSKGEAKAFSDTIKKMSNYNVTNDEIKLFSKINEECFQEFGKAKMTRIEFHHLRFKRILEALKIEADIAKTNALYVNNLRYNAEVYDDAIECIKYLSDKYELYVASNGIGSVQAKRMELSGLKNHFKKFYISEDIGSNKPNVSFFEYIFKDLNDYDKSHYLIIGDRLDTDILGGIDAGLKTIYINRKPDYEIKDLREIKNIL